jgi:asparagine synthase (glutamine-hydrolysing)
MCGISGVFGSRLPPQELPRLLARMSATLVHRGPDDCGQLALPEMGSGLACRRLSLVDLVTGNQPLTNEDGTVAVVMNGEIYNHRQLRAELELRGHAFRSTTDTEVVAHLFEQQGLECLERLNGMFGLAILDVKARRLILARDAAGMKPLYWTETPSGSLFASEVKALFASGLVAAGPDWHTLHAYLAVGFHAPPRSCFRGIEKLPAGGYVVIDGGGVRRGTFWRMRFDTSRPRRSDAEYAEEAEARLRAAVKSHLDADVPVGAFISGGLDSALVTTFAAQASSRPLRTFSLVFPDDPDVDESRYSRTLAASLGTEHEEVEFRAADIPALLPAAIRHLEEPCNPGPVLLEYHLAEAASKSVKAVMSGEGSDELFAGYGWLRSGYYYSLRRVVPRPIARLAGPLVSQPRLVRAAGILSARTDALADIEWFRAFTAEQKDSLLSPESRISEGDTLSLLPHPDTLASCQDHLQRRLSFDFTRRLGEAILFMSDKMNMAHSLEVRMPFLDRTLIDFALALPSDMKVRNGREKYILSLLGSHIPPAIAQRRKFGLHYPDHCLFSPIGRAYVRELLLDSAKPDGPLVRSQVETFLNRALRGPGEGTRLIWILMLLQAWWNEFF